MLRAGMSGEKYFMNTQTHILSRTCMLRMRMRECICGAAALQRQLPRKWHCRPHLVGRAHTHTHTHTHESRQWKSVYFKLRSCPVIARYESEMNMYWFSSARFTYTLKQQTVGMVHFLLFLFHMAQHRRTRCEIHLFTVARCTHGHTYMRVRAPQRCVCRRPFPQHDRIRHTTMCASNGPGQCMGSSVS